jgi:hypothetical protein
MPASRFAAWADAIAKTGVTDVTDVTQTGNLSFSATLTGRSEVTSETDAGVTGVTEQRPSSPEVTPVTPRTKPGVTEKHTVYQCGNTSNASNIESNRCAELLGAAHPPRAPWGRIEEERAAIIEYEAGIRSAWAEGFARLDPDRPPGDVPLKRWQRFVDDVGQFLDSPFCAVAAALNWGPFDLFGCDRERPFARVDRAGLLWLLAGNRLLALSENAAAIETKTGARQTYRRKPSEPGRVLPWVAEGDHD